MVIGAFKCLSINSISPSMVNQSTRKSSINRNQLTISPIHRYKIQFVYFSPQTSQNNAVNIDMKIVSFVNLLNKPQ
jgi:hypothetical protein